MNTNACLATCLNESQTHEIGAGKKENGLFKFQRPKKMVDSCPEKPS